MNWLARLEVDAETARTEGMLDNYAWHKRLWEGCFPDERTMPLTCGQTR